MDDNSLLNRTKLFKEFLESEQILWPAKSSDFNPIENLRDYLGRAIAKDLSSLKCKCFEDGIARRMNLNSPNCD